MLMFGVFPSVVVVISSSLDLMTVPSVDGIVLKNPFLLRYNTLGSADIELVLLRKNDLVYEGTQLFFVYFFPPFLLAMTTHL